MIEFADARSCWRIGAFGGLVLSLLTAAGVAAAAEATPYGHAAGEYENGRYVPSIFRQAEVPQAAPVIRLDPPRASYVRPKTATSTDTAGSTDGYRAGLYIADRDYLLSYPRTLWRMTSAPARFDRTDWLVAGGVAAAAGVFFAFDEDIRAIWQDHVRSGATEDIAKIFDPFGNAKIGLGVLLAAYGVSETLDRSGAGRWRQEKAATLLSLESLVISNGIVFGIKFASGRERPDNASSSFDFDGPGNGTNTNTSFPSGHAASAFAVASTLSEIYGDEHRWAPWVLYPLATATALTRIDRNKHWASDTFVGAAVGYFVGKTVTRYNPFLEKHNMAVVPSAENGEYSLSLVHRF